MCFHTMQSPLLTLTFFLEVPFHSELFTAQSNLGSNHLLNKEEMFEFMRWLIFDEMVLNYMCWLFIFMCAMSYSKDLWASHSKLLTISIPALCFLWYNNTLYMYF